MTFSCYKILVKESEKNRLLFRIIVRIILNYEMFVGPATTKVWFMKRIEMTCERNGIGTRNTEP